jgi:hypothetical protein
VSKLFALRSGFEDIVNIFDLNYSSQIKQQALLFDHIGILRLNAIQAMEEIVTDTQKEKISHNLMELQWLTKNKIIFDPMLLPKDLERLLTMSGQHHAIKYREADDEIKKWERKRKNKKRTEKELSNFFGAMARQDSIFLRLLSTALDKNEDYTTVTTLPEADYAQELSNSTKRDVVQVVISNLPLPDTVTPWEQIIDFRNDSDNKKNLLTLRRWIRKISVEEIRTAEVQEELEWLINEFESHMKLHKMKANTETLEVMVKAPFEIIENLINLKFSKIPEPLFALKKRQINLMEAELNAPGREMAYIIKSRDTFQSQE